MTTAPLTLAAIGVVFALAGRLVGLALAVITGTFTVLLGGFFTIYALKGGNDPDYDGGVLPYPGRNFAGTLAGLVVTSAERRS